MNWTNDSISLDRSQGSTYFIRNSVNAAQSQSVSTAEDIIC